MIDIPTDITGSWCEGEVHVLFKDSAFEPSSPTRHAAELVQIISEKIVDNPVLFLYMDGGPDHRLTYASVKCTLIALFIYCDLDYLCAAQTAPHYSYQNPVERVMSILNLGLQSVGLARRKLDDEGYEEQIQKCNSVSQIREQASKKPNFQESVLDTIAPVKVTLSTIARRLELKRENLLSIYLLPPVLFLMLVKPAYG